MSQSNPSNDGAWRSTSSSTRCPEALGLRGMVASAHPRAAVIGAAILEQGGNAFDAAIAVAAAEGVLLPMMCGLGGDAFVVLYDAARQELHGLNGSGVAGARATRDYYAAQGHRLMPLEGVHSVGVPGAVGVYETIWKRWG
ncbi:MAG: gamma-glutamyltransferase, partial [Chloroflexi bacterium]|nr:gamma-glutamyltransferase [Chloroflexota bacterium]